jgi:predicted Zn-dependent peptidase
VATLAQQAPDRSHPPQPGPPAPLNLPKIQKQKLSNGLPVWIVELHEVPVAQVNLVVLSGTANDPPGKYGVASLAAVMLEEGAGSRTALEVADAVDYLGADLGAATTSDLTAVRLHVPVARLADALPIMADIALRPTFPQSDLDRLRKERLTSLLQARDNVADISSVAFARSTARAPLRNAADGHGGKHQDVHRQTTCATFYTTTFRPENAVLLAVGRHHSGQDRCRCSKSLARWKVSATASGKVSAGEQPPARQVYRQNRAQRGRRSASADAARSTADFFPIRVMNTILGGSFTSRLNNNLRECTGITCGRARRSTCAARRPVLRRCGRADRQDVGGVEGFFNELNAILKPIPAEELARAKNYVALRYPSAFETTGDISRRLEDALVYKLPDDYFAKYVQNIQAVNAADVQRVAQKYIRPDHLAVVVVGDLKAIEPGIRALNLGAIKVMTIDEVFGPKP